MTETPDTASGYGVYQNEMIIAGDIGGTKVDLVLFSPSRGIRNPILKRRFPSEDYPDLETIITHFLDSISQTYTITSAAFGVAGPVINGRARITNLGWEISETTIRSRFTIPTVRLINDLVAIAEAVPHLRKDELIQLQRGESISGGALAVIAPGTGLGEAFLLWTGREYRAFPSEGGHTDFAPMNDLQQGLFDYLRNLYDHVSYERICSGIGIPDIFAYLRRIRHASCAEHILTRIESAADPTPLIVEEALKTDSSCPLCREVMNLFVSALGAEAGNLALKVLASGGVFLGGGIPPRILPFLKGDGFLKSFKDKGRFAGLLESIPVAVIDHPNAALIGACYCATRNLV